MRNITLWMVDDETYLKFRLICLGTGLSSAQLLKKMVDYWYQAEEKVPDKDKLRKMKRLVKKFKLKEE